MPNALRALDALGVGREFRALAPVTLSGGLRTGSGRWLTRWDSAQVQRLLGEPVVEVHRAELHGMLFAALPSESVRTGVEIIDAAHAGDAELVVAADGIDSLLRARRTWASR